VAVADLPTLREHFADDEVLFFRAGDAGALGEALATVAGDYDAALARARAALERYRRSYAWPLQAAGYVDLLDRLSSR